MKKITIFIYILFLSSFCFSNENIRNVTSNFFNKGSYVLQINDDSTKFTYIPKSSIARIVVTDEEFKYTYYDNNMNTETRYFSYKKWDIKSDDFNNLVLSLKK